MLAKMQATARAVKRTARRDASIEVSSALASSIVFHSALLHDRGPALGFLTDESGELRRRVGGGKEPGGVRLRLDGGIGQDLRHLGVELVDDRRRRALGCHEPEP